MPQNFFTVFWGNARLLVLAVFSGVLLAGCTGGAKPVVEPQGRMLESQVAELPQDSLRAKFVLTLTGEDGNPQELDAVLFSVPGKRYRMELTGPMGIGVASMLWLEEGWVITFPTEKLYMKGAGYMVGILNNGTLPAVHIHQVAALFEGRILPEGFNPMDSAVDVPESLKAAGVTMHAGVEKNGRHFAYALEDSSVVWLSRLGSGGKMETLTFDGYKEFDGYRVPTEIVFSRDGMRYLEIRVKKIAKNKAFSLGTWHLNVPRSFKQVGI